MKTHMQRREHAGRVMMWESVDDESRLEIARDIFVRTASVLIERRRLASVADTDPAWIDTELLSEEAEALATAAIEAADAFVSAVADDTRSAT